MVTLLQDLISCTAYARAHTPSPSLSNHGHHPHKYNQKCSFNLSGTAHNICSLSFNLNCYPPCRKLSSARKGKQTAASELKLHRLAPDLATSMDSENRSKDVNGSFEDTKQTVTGDDDQILKPMLSIVIPADSLLKFRESYEQEALKWPSDLATTTDFHKIEQFVSSAHSLVRKWLPHHLVSRLESFIHDPRQPSALIIRGLPIDDNLPPSTPQGHHQKNLNRQFMSEAWLVGIARIVGQPFIYDYLSKTGGGKGMALLIRELYPTPESEKEVSALGSKEFLDLHMDFFHLVPQCYPNCIIFMGLRGDPSKAAKTLLCDYRELYTELDPDSVAILRREKITWQGAGGSFSKYIVEGSDENPQINIFDENVGQSGGFEKMVRGSSAAVAAYRHVKEVARKVAMRGQGQAVWLGAGDVMLLNQRRSAHGRTSFSARYDGQDRWMQRIYANEGVIWKPVGLVPWPVRSLPLEVADKVSP